MNAKHLIYREPCIIHHLANSILTEAAEWGCFSAAGTERFVRVKEMINTKGKPAPEHSEPQIWV